MIKEKKIEGLSEVMDALKDIKVKVKVQLIKSFLRKAMMKEIIKPLRADLPYSRNIIKNIKIFTSRRDSNKTAIYGGPSSDVYWIRFMEKGTKQRYTKKGAFRGSIRAHNRIKPIIDTRINSLIDYTNKEFGNAMDEIIIKKLKKYRKV